MSEPTTVAEIEAWWANHHAAEEANPPTIARAYELAERSALKARAEYVAKGELTQAERDFYGDNFEMEGQQQGGPR